MEKCMYSALLGTGTGRLKVKHSPDTYHYLHLYACVFTYTRVYPWHVAIVRDLQVTHNGSKLVLIFTWYGNGLSSTTSQSDKRRDNGDGGRVDPFVVWSWGKVPLDTDLPSWTCASIDQIRPTWSHEAEMCTSHINV